jgi:hypothetical protein
MFHGDRSAFLKVESEGFIYSDCHLASLERNVPPLSDTSLSCRTQ